MRGWHWFRLARPRQWPKNLLVFAALVFSGNAGDAALGGVAALAFVALTLVTAAVYALNDSLDVDLDRAHPGKAHRPVAAGQVGVGEARIVACVWLAAGGALAGVVGTGYLAVLGVYAALQLAYAFALKRVPVLDVAVIAAGFVLRAYGGAVAIGVEASGWLLGCTASLAAFLALAKRRQDTVAGHTAGRPTRYSVGGLDALLLGAVAATIGSYSAYAWSVHGGAFLAATVPLVLIGVGRYLWLMRHRDAGAAPEEVLLTDWVMWVAVGGWAGVCWGMV